MKKIVLLIFTAFSTIANSQAPNIEWIRNYNDYNATSPQGSFTYNATDAQGNIYTLGKFSGTKDFDASSAVANLTAGNTTCSNYITKYDTSGNFVWAKTFGSIGTNGVDRPQAITIDTAGNVYATGSFVSTNDFDPGTATSSLQGFTFFGTEYDTMFILKLDTNGNFVWANNIGAVWSKGLSIKIDSNSNAIVSALLNSTSATIAKFNNIGTLIWQKDFTIGSNTNQFNAVATDSDNNIIMASNFSGTSDLDPGAAVSNVTSTSYSTDFFVVKLDPSGNFIFGKKIGAGFEDNIQSIAIDSNNDIYLSGTYITTVDFDPDDGVYNLTPTLGNGGNIYYNDGFILKLSSSGNFVWAKSIPSTTNLDYPYDLQIDANNNVYSIGVFQEYGNAAVDFDPGPGVYNLVGGASGSCYFLKLNQNGEFVWAFLGAPLGITWKDLRSLAIDSNGSLFLARTGYLIKINQPTTLGITNLNQSNVAVYPNPTTSHLNINLSNSIENGTLKIISIIGQTVLEKKNLSGTDFNLDVSNLSSGAYILELNNKGSKFNSKFIKK